MSGDKTFFCRLLSCYLRGVRASEASTTCFSLCCGCRPGLSVAYAVKETALMTPVRSPLFFFPPLPRRGKHCYKPTVDTGGTLPPAPLFLIKLKYNPSLRHRWSKMFLNGTLHCNLCCKSWPQASVKFRNGDAIKQFSASGEEGEKNGVTFCSISHPFL